MPASILMRSFLAVTAVPFIACTGCSTDSSGGRSPDAGASTGGSSAGTGGAAESGGTSSGTGGSETFDAAAAASCHADAGARTQCELCLETLCCDDFTACLRDPTCQKAFATYRSCILAPNQMDQPKCLSTFIRTGNGDAGGHEALYNCIFLNSPGCSVCGGASIL